MTIQKIASRALLMNKILKIFKETFNLGKVLIPIRELQKSIKIKNSIKAQQMIPKISNLINLIT